MGLGVEVLVGRGAAMGRRHRRMSRPLEIIKCRLRTRSMPMKKVSNCSTTRSADIVKKSLWIWGGDMARSEGTVGQDQAS